jgi:hypothetical protein
MSFQNDLPTQAVTLIQHDRGQQIDQEAVGSRIEARHHENVRCFMLGPDCLMYGRRVTFNLKTSHIDQWQTDGAFLKRLQPEQRRARFITDQNEAAAVR